MGKSTKNTAESFIYIGPNYPKGGRLVIKGRSYDPRNMTTEQIKKESAAFPQISGWWKVEDPKGSDK